MSNEIFNPKRKKSNENSANKENIPQKIKVAPKIIECKYPGFGSVPKGFHCNVCDLGKSIAPSWYEIFRDEFKKSYFKHIIKNLHGAFIVYPPTPRIFYFSHFFPIEKTNVVILGQDPYHNAEQATGLAFDVPKKMRIPPSLANIRREVKKDYSRAKCNLEDWARQGVLLLNHTLTVTEKRPNSHSHIGWGEFTNKILEYINKNCKNVVFMLWGAFAMQKQKIVDDKEHLVLLTSHPSPFSYSKGFKDCGHFKKANEYLKENNKKEINW